MVATRELTLLPDEALTGVFFTVFKQPLAFFSSQILARDALRVHHAGQCMPVFSSRTGGNRNLSFSMPFQKLKDYVSGFNVRSHVNCGYVKNIFASKPNRTQRPFSGSKTIGSLRF
jgi:hypothetical protein